MRTTTPARAPYVASYEPKFEAYTFTPTVTRTRRTRASVEPGATQAHLGAPPTRSQSVQERQSNQADEGENDPQHDVHEPPHRSIRDVVRQHGQGRHRGDSHGHEADGACQRQLPASREADAPLPAVGHADRVEQVGRAFRCRPQRHHHGDRERRTERSRRLVDDPRQLRGEQLLRLVGQDRERAAKRAH